MASSSSEPRTSGKKSFAIELYFDEELESNVLALVNIFKDHEMMADIKYRRCVTLFTTPYLDLQEFEKLIKTFASNHQCLPISFSRFDKSPDTKFIPTLQAKPTLSLHSFHVELCNVMHAKNVVIPEEYLPGFWAPGCIIGIEMAEIKFYNPAVVLMCQKYFPLNGNVTSVGLVEYADERTKVYLFPLKNVSHPENA